MIVDHCDNAIVEEEINSTETDRSMCEVRKQSSGERYMLGVNTPLELGGRSNPDVNYPDNLEKRGLDGCVKNVQQNGVVSYAASLGLPI